MSSRAVESTGDEKFGLEFVDSFSELGCAIGGVGVVESSASSGYDEGCAGGCGNVVVRPWEWWEWLPLKWWGWIVRELFDQHPLLWHRVRLVRKCHPLSWHRGCRSGWKKWCIFFHFISQPGFVGRFDEGIAMRVGTGGRGRVQVGRVLRLHDPFASVSTV